MAFLITADLLVAGVATLVQSLGFGPAGIRMPVMTGASFAAIAAGTRGFAHLPSASLTLRLYTSAAWFARLFAMYMSDKVGSHSV